MRIPADNKNGRRAGGLNLEALSPHVRFMYEKIGHLAPYTNAEYLAAVGVIEPSKESQPDPPAEVLAAMEAEDLAAIAWQLADRAYQDAARAAYQAGSSRMGGNITVIEDGRPSRRDVKKLAAAEEAFDHAGQAREESGDRLHRARVASNEAQTKWHHQMRADEYERTAKR